MFKKFLKFFTALSIALYSFSNLAIEIPACDTSECKSHFKEYKKYSKAGYADAMATLGDFYLKGHGTDKNLKKALKQYRAAAKYGSVKGQLKASMMYLTDEKYKDVAKGVKYLEKAARAKSSEAAFLLGVIYFQKEFYERDFDKSDKWIAKAYQANYKKSVAFIRYIDESNNLNTNNYPDLLDALSEKPLPIQEIKSKKEQSLTVATQQPKTESLQGKATNESKNKDTNESNSKDSNIEVITVTSDLHGMLTAQLAGLKNTYPQKGAVSTGSKIIGRSCDEMIACASMEQNQMNLLINDIMGAGAVATFYSSM